MRQNCVEGGIDLEKADGDSQAWVFADEIRSQLQDDALQLRTKINRMRGLLRCIWN
jgi:hypothetical protein